MRGLPRVSLLIDGKSPGVLRLQILCQFMKTALVSGEQCIHPNTNEIGQEMPREKTHKRMKMSMGCIPIISDTQAGGLQAEDHPGQLSPETLSQNRKGLVGYHGDTHRTGHRFSPRTVLQKRKMEGRSPRSWRWRSSLYVTHRGKQDE